jgi:hypothetical protein
VLSSIAWKAWLGNLFLELDFLSTLGVVRHAPLKNGETVGSVESARSLELWGTSVFTHRDRRKLPKAHSPCRLLHGKEQAAADTLALQFPMDSQPAYIQTTVPDVDCGETHDCAIVLGNEAIVESDINRDCAVHRITGKPLRERGYQIKDTLVIALAGGSDLDHVPPAQLRHIRILSTKRSTGYCPVNTQEPCTILLLEFLARVNRFACR